MLSNKLAILFIGALCMLGAAGGAYIATRQNAVPASAAAVAPATARTAASSVAAASNTPVQETEAVVSETAGKRTSAAAASSAATAKTASKREAPRPSVTSGAPPSRARSASPVATVAAARNENQAPSLERTWPATQPVPQSAAPAYPPVPDSTIPGAAQGAPATRADERVAPEPARAPEPPQRTLEELVVSADSVLGLQTETRISSETARVEDRVEARVTRDVKVGDQVAIPAGSRVIGSVMLVERGGKFKERARLGIQFQTLVLADGTRLPIKTETVYRDGEAPGNSSAAKIGGGAIGGAILGAILGGGKGAAIGATAGAGGGAAMVQNGDRSTATLPAGTPMTVRVLAPVTVTIEK